MSKFRVVSEGMYVIDPDNKRYPGLRQVPVWSGDLLPTIPELRQISGHQIDVETQAAVDGLASGDESEAILEYMLGEHHDLPSHWPLILQRRRVGRILGYSSLGTIRAADLLVENDEDYVLAPYWRNEKTKWADMSHEAKVTMLKLGATTGAALAVSAGLIYYENTH